MTTQMRFLALFGFVGLVISLQGQIQRGQMLCRGRLDLHPTMSVDLDNGNLSTPLTATSADIWYEAVNESESYLTPGNGAQIAVTSTSPKGFAGCAAARYTSNRVAIATLKPGTYLCVTTQQGRFTEIEVDGIYAKYPVLEPRAMTVSFTFSTWQN